jgi:hypothetical protein
MATVRYGRKTHECVGECPHLGWPHFHFEGGLVAIAGWPRTFVQTCPRCFTTTDTDDLEVANLILRYGCLSCRAMECDREYAIKQASPAC